MIGERYIMAESEVDTGPYGIDYEFYVNTPDTPNHHFNNLLRVRVEFRPAYHLWKATVHFGCNEGVASLTFQEVSPRAVALITNASAAGMGLRIEEARYAA